MSNRYKGGIISATPPTTTGGETGVASGAWTLEQQLQAQAAGNWPIQPPPLYIENVFSTWLYTGNGSTQTITNGINLSGKGGLVWNKSRNAGDPHMLVDTARGVNNYISSNSINAQNYDGVRNTVTGFLSNGFSLGDSVWVNNNGTTYVSWAFRDQAKFFDVVTWTGNGVQGRTVAHNLGSVPGCMFVKKTNSAEDWVVYHRSLGGNTKILSLNSTSGTITVDDTIFASDPTSTVINLGSAGTVNQSGSTYVAYLFAHNAGGFGPTETDNVITCGSYTGNGSNTNGTVVNLGWEPQWILVKRSTGGTSEWFMVDNMRGFAADGTDQRLNANLFGAEDTTTAFMLNATGFQLRATGNPNTSGSEYIYIAIRRGPMATPTTGTSVYNAVTVTGNSTANRRITGYNFPLDLLLSAGRTGSFLDKTWNNRLNGIYYVRSTTTAAEDVQFGGLADPPFAYMDGYQTGTSPNVQYFWNLSGETYVQYGMRRAPGFFDVVCYTGNNSVGQTISHNLGVVPELYFCKRRNGTQGGDDWQVYCSYLSSPLNSFLRLVSNAANGTNTDAWQTPTSTAIKIGAGLAGYMNASGGTYVAYLFASVPGVSKVGSYTGTGTTQTINCGFTGGARFVLIKRTDSTGDWYVWDTARGMIPANDPYLLLNNTAAEVTGTDFVDTAATGFEITSTAPAAINANGGTFIFLAIA